MRKKKLDAHSRKQDEKLRKSPRLSRESTVA
jgi:hypothetical protein